MKFSFSQCAVGVYWWRSVWGNEPPHECLSPFSGRLQFGLMVPSALAQERKKLFGMSGGVTIIMGKPFACLGLLCILWWWLPKSPKTKLKKNTPPWCWNNWSQPSMSQLWNVKCAICFEWKTGTASSWDGGCYSNYKSRPPKAMAWCEGNSLQQMAARPIRAVTHLSNLCFLNYCIYWMFPQITF